MTIRQRREGPTTSPQSRIVWILTENNGRMERSKLRALSGIRYSRLDQILADLTKEDKIRIEGEMVYLL